MVRKSSWKLPDLKTDRSCFLKFVPLCCCSASPWLFNAALCESLPVFYACIFPFMPVSDCLFVVLWTSKGAVSGISSRQHVLFLVPELTWPRGKSGCYRWWTSWSVKSLKSKSLVALSDAREPRIPLLLRGNNAISFCLHFLSLYNSIKELPHGPSSLLFWILFISLEWHC